MLQYKTNKRIKSFCPKTQDQSTLNTNDSKLCLPICFSPCPILKHKTEQVALPEQYKTALTTEITQTSWQTSGFMKQHSDLSEHSAKIGK